MTDKASSKTNAPTLIWDVGTAYELFISLYVLHQPEIQGLRASWAAGIRSRIPAAERKFLEEIVPFLGFPIGWVYRLPKPKDAISVMWALRQIPPEKRIATVTDIEHWGEPEVAAVFMRVAERQAWEKKDFATLMEKMCKEPGCNEQGLEKYLDWWARPALFGETLLAALQAYYQAFFEDEEKRVAPVLQAGLEHAQQLAQHLDLHELLVELSQGIHFEDPITTKELVIIPAYWTTPLIVFEKVSEERTLLLFGARPANMSAIPGEFVPDGLLRTLKSLADPTRLKILHYLSQEELTPSKLAQRLHLRAPTLTHHMSDLRLAGLVNLTIRGQEKFYTSRIETIDSTHAILKTFLQKHPEGEGQ
jgi:DNA-binding transcriptional ArsR family regulator